jgi:hypothetical protein
MGDNRTNVRFRDVGFACAGVPVFIYCSTGNRLTAVGRSCRDVAGRECDTWVSGPSQPIKKQLHHIVIIRMAAEIWLTVMAFVGR